MASQQRPQSPQQQTRSGTAARPATGNRQSSASRPGVAMAQPTRQGSGDDESHERITSIDLFRGLVMLLMLAECLHLCRLADSFPDNNPLQLLCYHQTHVAWAGFSLHDLIQPGFTFLVGVALPFSIASRRRRKQNILLSTFHAFWRAALLVALGIFLRSIGREQTYFTFEDTLTQIGLGYGILYLLGFHRGLFLWLALIVILGGYYAAFALYPVPSEDFDWQSAGVTEDWEHNESGFAAHWNKNTNFAWSFDRWFLNLFPRESEFEFNSGGYATLSFIPTLATMILGLIAGQWFRDLDSRFDVLMRLLAVGVGLVFAGVFLDEAGICPLVKRIWTPSWVLFSGGCCFVILGLLSILADKTPWRKLFIPITLVGMNSIAAYCMSWLFAGFLRGAIRTHVPSEYLQHWGLEWEPFVVGAGQLALIWLILAWMCHKKIFIRI